MGLATVGLLWGAWRFVRPTQVLDGLPEIPPAVREKVKAYQDVESAAFVGWSPDDGEMYVASQIHHEMLNHRVGTAGAVRASLSAYPEPRGRLVVCPRPDTRRAVFAVDHHGNEQFHLVLYDFATGATSRLTDGKSKHSDPVWSPHGTTVYYAGNQRNGKDFDVWRVGVDPVGTPKRLTEQGGAWFPLDVTPDERFLLVRRHISFNESPLFLLELATKRLTPMVTSTGAIKRFVADAKFSKDGRQVYYLSNEPGEYQSLMCRSVADPASVSTLAAMPWNIETLVVSPDGKRLAYLVNEDGISALYLMDCFARTSRRASEVPLGLITTMGFHPNGRDLALSINGAQTPGDVYVLDTDTRRLTRWTTSRMGGLESDALVRPILVRYETFDKVNGKPRAIPAFLYKPTGKRGQGTGEEIQKYPVVIGIHGGPEWQERPGFNPTLQYLVRELGCAVVTPNVRGSTGYGAAYLALDDGFKREDAVKDIGALLDWIAQQPDLDADRVAVIGGSYGGFMVLASMVAYSPRLRCGAVAVGISNFVTFLENTSRYRRDLRRVEYGNESDPAMRVFLERIAPVNHASTIARPLFVVQGANDSRVPPSEAEHIVKAVRANGQPVWNLLFRNEGHGRPSIGFGRFERPENDLLYSSALAMFLEAHLVRPIPNGRH